MYPLQLHLFIFLFLFFNFYSDKVEFSHHPDSNFECGMLLSFPWCFDTDMPHIELSAEKKLADVREKKSKKSRIICKNLLFPAKKFYGRMQYIFSMILKKLAWSTVLRMNI